VKKNVFPGEGQSKTFSTGEKKTVIVYLGILPISTN
jgi:hypothetical protein